MINFKKVFENKKVKQALKEHNMQANEVEVMQFIGGRWRVLQKGKKEGVAIHFIGNKPSLVTPL